MIPDTKALRALLRREAMEYGLPDGVPWSANDVDGIDADVLVAAVNALPGLLDAADERDALRSQLASARAANVAALERCKAEEQRRRDAMRNLARVNDECREAYRQRDAALAERDTLRAENERLRGLLREARGLGGQRLCVREHCLDEDTQQHHPTCLCARIDAEVTP